MKVQIKEDDERSTQSYASGEVDATRKLRERSEDTSASKKTETSTTLARKETQVLRFIKSDGVMLILLGAAIIMVVVTYRYTRNYEIDRFHDSFENNAEHLINSYHNFLVRLLWAGATMATRYTVEASKQRFNSTDFLHFPFLALDEFKLAAFSMIQVDGLTSVSYAPLLSVNKRDDWEIYANEFISIANPGFARPEQENWTGIYELDENNDPISSERNGMSMPVWQLFPVQSHDKYLMFDLQSDPVKKRSLDAMLLLKSATPSAHLLDETEKVFDTDYDGSPRTQIFFPVFNASDDKIVRGTVTVELS
jgi:hypothetical protein